MAFNHINIIKALNDGNRDEVYRKIHTEFMRIQDEDWNMDKAERLTNKNYTELFNILLDTEKKELYRMDAAICIFYKQNVYEIDALVSGE